MARDLGREFGQAVRLVPREFERLAGPVRRPREHHRRRGGVVGPGSGGNPALAGAAHQGAVGKHRRDRGRVVFRIPPVAQQHDGQAGLPQERFRFAVLARQTKRRRVGVQHAGIGQQLDAGALRRLHDIAVLRRAAAQVVGGDEQNAADAGQGGIQGIGLLVVRHPGLDAHAGEPGRGRAAADHGDDPVAGDRGEQAVDDQPTKLAACAGDEQEGLGRGHGGVAPSL